MNYVIFYFLTNIFISTEISWIHVFLTFEPLNWFKTSNKNLGWMTQPQKSVSNLLGFFNM